MNLYLLIKAFHLIFMVAWFAGLFYIFRLFVYHVKFQFEPKLNEVYPIMEKKLLFIIMHPAMVLTMVLGGILLYLNPALLEQRWIHLKLGLVILLIAYQTFAVVTYRKFKAGNFFLSERACRLINEVPTFLLVAIVLLAILKPVL